MWSKHSLQQRNQHQIKSTKKETKVERVVIQSQNNYSFRLGYGFFSKKTFNFNLFSKFPYIYYPKKKKKKKERKNKAKSDEPTTKTTKKKKKMKPTKQEQRHHSSI